MVMLKERQYSSMDNKKSRIIIILQVDFHIDPLKVELTFYSIKSETAAAMNLVGRKYFPKKIIYKEIDLFQLIRHRLQ